MTIAAWSPDGRRFAVADDGLLYLLTMDTTGPTWSWSGRQRLTRERQSILAGTCSFSPDGLKVIFVVVHKGESTSLQIAEVERGIVRPSRHVSGSASMSLQIAGVEGGEERALVDAGSCTDVYACWSPDGRRVAYSAAKLDSSGKRAGQSGIYVLGVDGRGEQPSTVLEEFHPPEIIRLRLVDWR